MRTTSGRLIAGKLLLLAGLAVAVTELSVVSRLDIALTRTVHDWTVGWLTGAVVEVSDLAATQTVMWVTAAALSVLLWHRHFRGAAALALAVVATQGIVAIAKAVMERPRPADDMAIADPAGWSFPSAHSASAVALYVTCGLIATTIWRRKLPPAIVFAVAGTIVLLVGLSRVYLGAHYATDVLAGWLTGGIVVAVSWAACARLPHPGRPAAAG